MERCGIVLALQILKSCTIPRERFREINVNDLWLGTLARGIGDWREPNVGAGGGSRAKKRDTQGATESVEFARAKPCLYRAFFCPRTTHTFKKKGLKWQAPRNTVFTLV